MEIHCLYIQKCMLCCGRVSTKMLLSWNHYLYIQSVVLCCGRVSTKNPIMQSPHVPIWKPDPQCICYLLDAILFIIIIYIIIILLLVIIIITRLLLLLSSIIICCCVLRGAASSSYYYYYYYSFHCIKLTILMHTRRTSCSAKPLAGDLPRGVVPQVQSTLVSRE